ncbi:MAG: RodZ domain-containing protein [Pseudomonadota bacterium]
MNEPTFEGLGLRLKARREEKGVSLREISETTKIPVSVLEAIEAGDSSRLPAVVFIKGFLRSYALEIGMSPEEVIQEYKFQTPDQVEPAVVPVTARRDALQGPSYWIGLLVLVLAVIVGGGAYLLYPQFKSGGLFGPAPTPPPALEEQQAPPEQTDEVAQSPASPVPAEEVKKDVAEPSKPTEVAAAEQETIEPAVVAEAPSPTTKPAEELPPPAPESTVAASIPVPETPAPETAAPAQASEGTPREHLLKLEFIEEVWVSLLIDGKIVRHGLYKSGMSETWNAESDFRLNVGNAGGVRVFFDGQDLGVPGKQGQVVNIVLPKPE